MEENKMNILESAERGVYWKSIIYDIIAKEGFDPWDIDVGMLADSYIQKVREIRMINFEVPGTVILVGSVLLKMKSDVVSGQTFMFEESLVSTGDAESPEGPVADFESDFESPLEVGEEELPPSLIEPRLYVRRIPKRKVTLPELITFLKRVVGQVEKKERLRREMKEHQLEVQIAKKNVERIMREVYREIRRLSAGGRTTFRELVEEWKRESIIAYLIPVLHLAHKEKINVEQEELFGEIFISPR